MEFRFTLKFELNEGPEPDRLLKRLAGAGCSHTFMDTGARALTLRFTREADGAMAAAMDVLAVVKSALPQARLRELSPAFNGHSARATQVVAATLWLLAQPSQSPAAASLDCAGRPTEAIEEIRVSNQRSLVGIATAGVDKREMTKVRPPAPRLGDFDRPLPVATNVNLGLLLAGATRPGAMDARPFSERG
ncbi:MAG: hypothetical protein P4L96_12495 [Rhodoferax sp.]|nr:hypothetical protein [Rhodoferax sp.]